MKLSSIPSKQEIDEYIEDSCRHQFYRIRVLDRISVNGEWYYSCIDDNYAYSFHQWIPEELGKKFTFIAIYLYEYDEEEENGCPHYYELDLCWDVDSKFFIKEVQNISSEQDADSAIWD